MRFEKVSKDTWIKQCIDLGITKISAEEAYEKIKIPTRATSDSCGYDFVSPLKVNITDFKTVFIPTGIRVFLDEGMFLLLAPRSSCVKRGYTMSNNIGIIDRDYVNADNEGNIMAPVISTGKVSSNIKIESGEKIAQGIILPFATIGDVVETTRSGGFGSTGVIVNESSETEEIVNEDNETSIKEENNTNENHEGEYIDDAAIDSLFKKPEVKVEEPNEEDDEVEEEKNIMVNNHLIIEGNIINATIINEIDRHIEYAKLNNPQVYFDLIKLKNKASSLNDIEQLFNIINNWISSIDLDYDTMLDVYIRDANIVLINHANELPDEYMEDVIGLMNIIRNICTNEEKLKAAQLIYKYTITINDENINKLITDIRTILEPYKV